MSGPGQFERARERAAAAVRDTPSADAVAVMSFALTANSIAPLSRDRGGALCRDCAAATRLRGDALQSRTAARRARARRPLRPHRRRD